MSYSSYILINVKSYVDPPYHTHYLKARKCLVGVQGTNTWENRKGSRATLKIIVITQHFPARLPIELFRKIRT